MDAKEKRKFIRNLTAAVRDNLLRKVKNMPECWDGIELRMLLADSFASEVRPDMRKGKRAKDFRNEVLTRNI